MLNLSVVNGKIVGFNKVNQIYICRQYKHQKASVLANPFRVGKDGDKPEVIQKYRRWLWQEFNKNGAVTQELEKILNRLQNGEEIELVCWCAPGICHGDMIKKMFDMDGRSKGDR